MYSATARTGLTREQQAAVGRTCKRLIDAGRVQLLRDMGFSVSLKVLSVQSERERERESVCVCVCVFVCEE